MRYFLLIPMSHNILPPKLVHSQLFQKVLNACLEKVKENTWVH